MRVQVRATVLSLVGAAALVVPVSSASAGACPGVAERASTAEVVFVGTVEGVMDSLPPQASMRVSDVYKGSVGSSVTVRPEARDADWDAASQYVVFGSDAGDAVESGTCQAAVPVTDEVLDEVASVLGPATPLARGAGAASPSATPTTAAPDGAGAAPASDERDTGTSRLALGIALGIALAASFFLPQLRRHNRERRRARDDGDTA